MFMHIFNTFPFKIYVLEVSMLSLSTILVFKLFRRCSIFIFHFIRWGKTNGVHYTCLNQNMVILFNTSLTVDNIDIRPFKSL